jgi:cytoskeleton protein RodZ
MASEPETRTAIQAIELPNANLESASAPVAEQVVQPEAVPQAPVRTAPVAATAPVKVVKGKEIQKESGQVPVIVSEAKKPAKVKTEPVKTELVNTERAKPARTPVKPAQQEAVRSDPVPAVSTGSTSVSDAAVKVNPVMNFSEHALRLEFDEDAWVEIKDGNDKVLISRMHRAGSLLRVAGKSPLDVTIGNAKAVRLFDKGKKINLGRHTTADVAHLKLK